MMVPLVVDGSYIEPHIPSIVRMESKVEVKRTLTRRFLLHVCSFQRTLEKFGPPNRPCGARKRPYQGLGSETIPRAS